MDRRAHLPRWVPQRPIWNRDAKWLRTSVAKCCGNRPGGASNHHRQVTAQWKLGLYVIAPPFASGIRMPQRLDWRQGGTEGPTPRPPRRPQAQPLPSFSTSCCSPISIATTASESSGGIQRRGPSPSLLIDCEEDRTLRAVLVGMLREARYVPRTMRARGGSMASLPSSRLSIG